MWSAEIKQKIINNIPKRSVNDMKEDTMDRLFELKNIIGVKDETGILDRVEKQKKKFQKQNGKISYFMTHNNK